MPPHRNAYRPVVMGARGVVTSAHPLASMAGVRMLLQGGNAADAAVAVAAALNVVEPFMSGIGGVGLMLVSRGGGRERHVLDFIGTAPQAATTAGVTEADLAGGPKSCAIPGNPAGWIAAHERFGALPRATVFGPAIAMAEGGVPLPMRGWTERDLTAPPHRSRTVRFHDASWPFAMSSIDGSAADMAFANRRYRSA